MGLLYSLAHYHHGGKYAIMHTYLILEDLRVLYLDLRTAEGDCVILAGLGHIWDLKSHLHSDTLHLTRPYLLIVALPKPSIQTQGPMGPFLLTTPHWKEDALIIRSSLLCFYFQQRKFCYWGKTPFKIVLMFKYFFESESDGLSI